MEIKQFVWNVVDSNSWLIIEGNAGFLVDAIDSKELYEEIENLDNLTIVLTHSHFDHIVGLNRIREVKPECIVIATKLCSEHIGNKYRNMSSAATAFMMYYKNGTVPEQIDPFECDPANIVFDNKFTFDWCGYNVKLLSVFGHTNDGLIVVMDDKLLFSGDTLLHVPTVTRFPTGNKELYLSKDVPLIKNLRMSIVYPGHGGMGRAEIVGDSQVSMFVENSHEKVNN